MRSKLKKKVKVRGRIAIMNYLNEFAKKEWRRKMLLALCSGYCSVSDLRDRSGGPVSSIKYYLSRLERLKIISCEWRPILHDKIYWIKVCKLDDSYASICEQLKPKPRRRVVVEVSYNYVRCREDGREIECPEWILNDPKVVEAKQFTERVKRETGYTFVSQLVFYEF